MNAAYQIGYTFNWFYTDDKHIAYFNSGLNPVRAPHTDPLFPSWAKDAWRGLHPAALMTPASLTEDADPGRAPTPRRSTSRCSRAGTTSRRPATTTPPPARSSRSIYRSQLLDNNINHYLAGGRGKLTLADLSTRWATPAPRTCAGSRCCRTRSRSSATRRPGAGRPAVASCAPGWRAARTGSTARSPGASGDYDQSDAVRIMDAWWPLLVKAEFQPVLGRERCSRRSRATSRSTTSPATAPPASTSAPPGTSASTGSSRRTCARCSAARSAAASTGSTAATGRGRRAGRRSRARCAQAVGRAGERSLPGRRRLRRPAIRCARTRSSSARSGRSSSR